MARSVEEIGKDIRKTSPETEGWDRFRGLLEELRKSAKAASQAEAVLRFFERHPGVHDGGGTFWRSLHLLESLPGYREVLHDSVRRRPSLLALTMIERLLNDGKKGADEWLVLLHQLAENSRLPSFVRAESRRIADRFA